MEELEQVTRNGDAEEERQHEVLARREAGDRGEREHVGQVPAAVVVEDVGRGVDHLLDEPSLTGDDIELDRGWVVDAESHEGVPQDVAERRGIIRRMVRPQDFHQPLDRLLPRLVDLRARGL